MNENELQVLRELVEIGAEELMSTDPHATLAEPANPGPEGTRPGTQIGRCMLDDDSLDPSEAFTQWKAGMKKGPAPAPRRRDEPLDGQTSLLD